MGERLPALLTAATMARELRISVDAVARACLQAREDRLARLKAARARELAERS
jgi:hypothetical protein